MNNCRMCRNNEDYAIQGIIYYAKLRGKKNDKSCK